ncbi:MAG: TRAP transporter large permease subunit [Pseudomonadota bacterium]
MGWQLNLLLIFGSMLIMMATGMPIAFAFLSVVVVGSFTLFGGIPGLDQMILSIYSSLTTFTLLPIPLFILMGELMVQSGIALNIIDVLNKWLGRLPGRLGLLAVVGGTLLSTLTGASMASTATLGAVLVPEMEKRGYTKPMSLGPILGSGGLAIMIPPSALAIILGAIGEISIGKILVAIIVPGLCMAAFYAAYIVLICILKPYLAPSYDVASVPLREKIAGFIKYVLPTSIIIFLVIGLIFLGVATPSESAASGTVGMVIVIAFYGRLNWGVLKKAMTGTLKITGMVFMIIAGSQIFSQVLSFSGATQGLIEYALNLKLNPVLLVIAMQIVIMIMGAFMDPVGIMMITLPIFVPFIRTLGFNDVWFAALVLLNIEMAMVTPPFGMCLFVMKGVAPKDTTMGDIYRAVVPFLLCDALVMILIFIIPGLALWLPGLGL